MTYGDRLVTEHPANPNCKVCGAAGDHGGLPHSEAVHDGRTRSWVPAPVPHAAPDETLYLDGAIPADADGLVCDSCSSGHRVQVVETEDGPVPLCVNCRVLVDMKEHDDE